MKIRPLLPCGLALGMSLAALGTAVAGGQQIAVEVAKDGKSLLVRTYRCGTPSSFTVSGRAEGIVDGQRRTIPLRVMPTAEPGVFAVERQWPAQGAWVLAFAAEGGRFVNALVELQPGSELRIASQESSVDRLTPERVADALRRLTRS
jgi:hypothetical protein